MKSKPLVSVIMPAYNAKNYLEAAIKSILNQTYPHFEFIIVDDGSQDATAEIIQKYQKKDKRIVVLRNRRNLGTTKSLNMALKAAKGKYIVRMDADDWSYPSRLAKQVELMESDRTIVVSGSYIEVCDKNLRTINIRKYPLEDSQAKSQIFRYSPFAHPATVWRASTLKKVGGYDEKIRVAQDYELYFRIGKHGKFKNLDKVLLKLRVHQDSVSISKSRLQAIATIAIRRKAVVNMGYKISFLDIVYISSQIAATYLLPAEFRFYLFNYLRRFDFF